MPGNHVVRQGECLSSIAADHGFGSYKALYDHPANAELKRKRPNPNLIYPGDVIVIPDRVPKKVSLPTGAVHRIVVSRPRRTVRLTLEDADHAPLTGTSCTLTIGGRTLQGVTNGSGLVEFEVPVGAGTGTLVAGRYRWPLEIGALNPVADTDDGGVSGIQARLRNMGHDPGPIDGVLGPKTEAAIRAFQARHALTVSGQPDEPTRAKLLERHGC